jgi:hypothetical protein
VHVTGLPEHGARALLVSARPGPVDDRVLERLIAESQGNPLALLELPRGFTPAELAGGFGPFSAVAVPHRIEERFRRQVATFAPTTRQVLLVAAAEPLGDPVLLWRAGARLGLDLPTAAAAAAEAAGLVEFASRVRFRHPLLRSVIHTAASPDQRRRAHWALAEVTEPGADRDRRAWHLARATTEPDEDVAAALEHCAARARARGGPAAAASFLEPLAELTPDPARRGQRKLAAAQARYLAGMPDAASRLLALADAGPLGELDRTRAELLRARIAFSANRGSDTPALLLKAAAALEPLDARLARDTYLEALRSAWFAAHLSGGTGLREVAEAARAAPPPVLLGSAPDLLLGWLGRALHRRLPGRAPIPKEALRAFHGAVLSEGVDDDAYTTLANRYVQIPRDRRSRPGRCRGVRPGRRRPGDPPLDGGHFLLESAGDQVAGLVRDFLARSLAPVPNHRASRWNGVCHDRDLRWSQADR